MCLQPGNHTGLGPGSVGRVGKFSLLNCNIICMLPMSCHINIHDLN